MSLEFLQKEKLRTGFGEEITAKSYDGILTQAGLDWTVNVHPAYASYNGKMIEVPGMKVVVRDQDMKTLGVVSDKYKIVNNVDAFKFTESLIEDGSVEFIRGGSYKGGKSTWLEAKVTTDYEILGDKTECYLIFKNTHDGTGSVICMIVPTRIACSNAINLALRNAPRHWRCVHSGNPLERIAAAKEVLLSGTAYMDALNVEAENLQKIKLSDEQIIQFTNRLFPINDDMTERIKGTRETYRSQLLSVFHEKDDLQDFGNSGYRFVSAVADYIDHAEGKRTTATADANRFMKVAYGSEILDKAYTMVKAA